MKCQLLQLLPTVFPPLLQLIRTSMQEPFYEPGKPWAATELPQEHAAFLPCWFTCNYAFRGNQGFWDRTPVAAVSLAMQLSWRSSMAA
jgi:hypothetical protein